MIQDDLKIPFIKSVKTRVTYKDGTLYQGYFQPFDDHKLLVPEGKYRFVPEDKTIEIQNEFFKTNKLNKSHSVVINLQMVEDIELLRR